MRNALVGLLLLLGLSGCTHRVASGRLERWPGGVAAWSAVMPGTGQLLLSGHMSVGEAAGFWGRRLPKPRRSTEICVKGWAMFLIGLAGTTAILSSDMAGDDTEAVAASFYLATAIWSSMDARREAMELNSTDPLPWR